MANIFDIARIAGVSTSTVSLAMRNSSKLNEATRLRVQAVAARLNYKPSRIARSLVQKRTNAIGVILPSSANPIYVETSALIEKAAFASGYDTFACFIEEDPLRERRFLEKIYEQQFDGLILVPAYPDVNRDSYASLAASRLPIVIRDEIEWLAGVDSVAVDMEQGGYDAVKHLLALGHTRIACVTTMLAAGRKLGRLKGYRKALAEMGIAFDETLVRPCGTNLDDGRKVTKEILAMKDRPSAIFLQCDLLAMGAFSAVRQAGLKIPDDISLVGFDDISFAPYLESPLTTVAHPKEKVAAALVKTLAHRIQNKEAAARHIVITPQLIVRKSSARPRDFSSQPKQGVRRPQPCRQ